MATEGNKEKYFSIEWDIENMSYCPEKMGGKIDSPPFIVDAIRNTIWNLQVFPRGQEGKSDYIGVYLLNDMEDRPEIETGVKFELAFIGKGNVVAASKTFELDLKETEKHGTSEFVMRKEVYDTKRSVFLPEGTLTVRCKIWLKDGSMPEHVRCFSRTRISVEKRSFLWDLKNFSNLESEQKCTHVIKSPSSASPMMSVDLFVTAGVYCDEIIRFELTPEDENIKYSTFKLSLVDATKHRVETNQGELWVDEYDECEKFTFFFSRNRLLANKRVFLPNDTLSLEWEWAFSNGIGLQEIREVQYGCTSTEATISDDQEVNGDEEMPTTNPLLDSLKSLYAEKFICDVELKTSTSTFPAHKVILCASSSVFRDMFSSEEEDNGEVVIENLEDEAVEQMLHYIYFPTVEDLTWKKAIGLLQAANKYAILNLKDVCLSYLKENLSTNNAIEALMLAGDQDVSDLKSAALDYIMEHGKEIGNSDWRLLINSNGQLAAEALYRVFCEN